MQWLLFLATMTTVHVQVSEPVSPYWLALTVADAEASADWYRDHLGFEVIDRMDLPERGVHIRFLKRDGFHLEIVQRGDSFAVADKVPQDFKKSQVRGYFKFGLFGPGSGRLGRQAAGSGRFPRRQSHRRRTRRNPLRHDSRSRRQPDPTVRKIGEISGQGADSAPHDLRTKLAE